MCCLCYIAVFRKLSFPIFKTRGLPFYRAIMYARATGGGMFVCSPSVSFFCFFSDLVKLGKLS